FAGFRVLAHHRLARALEAMEGRRTPGSTATLELLAKSPLSPRQVRRTAKLSVAMTRLQEGRGLDALGWFEDLDDGEIGAWAATGRAMASLLLGQDPDDAEVHLNAAFESPWANEVRAQADAVRILVVWRRDGPREARSLAESLRSGASTPLHLALLARLRGVTDDGPGAASLESEAVRALLDSGLGRAIPELTPSRLAKTVR
ncbi:MAG: hypothetical protein AAF211_16880, partial [Myxococcota bacterium]